MSLPVPPPRRNLSFGSRAFHNFCTKKYGILYLLTFCGPKHSVHLGLGVIYEYISTAFSQPILPHSAHLHAPWSSSETLAL